MKYIALLRGINISGKNKVSMSELKLELEKNKYKNVSTYLNSGNVIFESVIDNKEIYDNLIFIIPPTRYEEIYDIIGKPKEDIEKIEEYNNSIFWSYDLKNYRKSNWWSRTASTSISDKITIRTANTMKKVLEICKR